MFVSKYKGPAPGKKSKLFVSLAAAAAVSLGGVAVASACTTGKVASMGSGSNDGKTKCAAVAAQNVAFSKAKLHTLNKKVIVHKGSTLKTTQSSRLKTTGHGTLSHDSSGMAADTTMGNIITDVNSQIPQASTAAVSAGNISIGNQVTPLVGSMNQITDEANGSVSNTQLQALMQQFAQLLQQLQSLLANLLPAGSSGASYGGGVAGMPASSTSSSPSSEGGKSGKGKRSKDCGSKSSASASGSGGGDGSTGTSTAAAGSTLPTLPSVGSASSTPTCNCTGSSASSDDGSVAAASTDTSGMTAAGSGAATPVPVIDLGSGSTGSSSGTATAGMTASTSSGTASSTGTSTGVPVAVTIPPAPTTSAKPVTNAPVVPKARRAGGQWAGYVAQGSKFTSVSGSWKVPAVQCDGTSQKVIGAWVGIDGVATSVTDNPTIQQIGSDIECNGTTAVQRPWYEFYPAPSQYIDTAKYPVAPGDNLTASISATGNTFTMKLVSSSSTHKAWTFTTSQTVADARFNSAEWAVEAPAVDDQTNTDVPQFADFNFTNCIATSNGKSTPVSSLPGLIVDLSDNSGAIRTNTSDLNADGKSFKVSYK